MTALLYLTKILVYFLWKQKFDPDNWAIPLLTAIGNLLQIILFLNLKS